MLWIALFLPELPLQAAQSGLPADGFRHVPFAISNGLETRPIICATNEAARQRGIHPGQTLAMARALSGDLVAIASNPERENDALRKVATAASQFTPNVALASSCVLLEVSASLALFGGLGHLLAQLRSGLRESGYHALAGVAPTPLAAWLFAKARITNPAMRGTLHGSDLAERLADLPLALFEWPGDAIAALAHLGITRIRDLRMLPRDGVTRRFGGQIIADLDRALGRLPDPRPYFILPETFSTRVEFVQEVEHFEGLRFPLRRILGELEIFLRVRGAATREWVLEFEHGRNLKSTLCIKTQDATRDRVRWETLLNERATRTPLAGTVSAISFSCNQFESFTPANASWLPDKATEQGKWHELAERLAARLGEATVFSIAQRDDHRPELAWTTSQKNLSRPLQRVERKTAKEMRQRSWPARPVWLLATPRALVARNCMPHYHGDLNLLAGPERIEAGWWDGKPAQRDYFVARNQNGETLWVYRDLHAPERWYLHGFFA
jgi:protein ImuB